MIGKRLKLARGSAGLSLRELSVRIDNVVSAQAIGKYERDEMMPGSKVLIAMSQALDVPVSYLAGPNKIQLDGVEFRRNRITSRKEENQVEAAVLSHLDRYLELEEILQVASVEWEKPREAPFPVRVLQDAEVAAMSMREHWDLGTNPVPSFAEFLEERGIKVMALNLPASVSGLTCWAIGSAGRRVPVIVINANDTGERQRFTLSHELGHMVMDVADGVNEEKAAHWFAGALLMPRDTIFSEIGRNRSSIGLGELFALKEIFGVSVQAITYRCKDLGIVSQTAFRQLFDVFEEKGWRKPPFPEPQPVPHESPRRFRRLCFRALAENAISESKAAELLGMSVRRLNSEMEDAPAA
ncbi:MAG: ImmA/IrrE family metallo-endopeptidase [Rhodospirillales bacterium]|nr:ImmA/IrrE family metallo-endopeptidase [Rhodospirillales bacterium]